MSTRIWKQHYAWWLVKTRNGLAWLGHYYKSDDGYVFKTRPDDAILDLWGHVVKSYCKQYADWVSRPSALGQLLEKANGTRAAGDGGRDG